MKTGIQKIINFYILLCLLFTTETIFTGLASRSTPRPPQSTSPVTSKQQHATSTTLTTPRQQPQKVAPSRLNLNQIDKLHKMLADKKAAQNAIKLEPQSIILEYKQKTPAPKVDYSNVSNLFEKRKNISIVRDDAGSVTELVHRDDLGSIQITKNPSIPNYISIKTRNQAGSLGNIIQDTGNVQPDTISGTNKTTQIYFKDLAQQNPKAKFYTEPTRAGETKNKRVVITDEQSTKIIELNKDGAIVKNREYRQNGAFKDLATPENININRAPATTPNSDPTMISSEKMEAPLETYTTKLKNDAGKAYPRIPKNVLDDLLPSYAREAIEVAATSYTSGAVLGYNKVAPNSVNFMSRGQRKPRTDLEKASAGLDAMQEAFAENPNFDKTYQTTYQDKYMPGPAQDYVIALRAKFPNAPDSIIRTYVTEYLNTMPRENAYKSFFTRDPNKPQVIPTSKITENPDWDTKTIREMGEDVIYDNPTRLQKMYAGLQGMESMATKAHIANLAAKNPALSSLLQSAPRRLASDPKTFLQEVLKEPTIAALGSESNPAMQKHIELIKSYINGKATLNEAMKKSINILFNQALRGTMSMGKTATKWLTATAISFFNPDPNGAPSMFAIEPETFESFGDLKTTTINSANKIMDDPNSKKAVQSFTNDGVNSLITFGAQTFTQNVKPFTDHDTPQRAESSTQEASYINLTPETHKALGQAKTAAIQLGNKGAQALANAVVNTAEQYSQPANDSSPAQDVTPTTSILTPETLQAGAKAAHAVKNAVYTQAEIALGIKPPSPAAQTPDNPTATRKRSNSMSQMPTEQAPRLQRSRSFSQGDESPTDSKKPLITSQTKSDSTSTKPPVAGKPNVKSGSITNFFSSGIEKLRNSPEKIRAFVSSSIDKISDLLGVTPKNKAAAQQKADIEITNAIKNKNSWFYAKDAATFHNGVNAMITSFYKSIGRDNPAQTKIVEINNQSNPASPNITFAYHEGRVKTATVEYNGNKFKVNKDTIQEQKGPDGSTEYIITTPLFTTPQELTLAQKINNKLFNTTIKNNLVEPVRMTGVGRMIDEAQPGTLDNLQDLLTASGSKSDGLLVLKVQKDRITTHVTRKNPQGSAITTTKEYTTQDPDSATQTSHKVAIEPTPGDNFSPSIKIQYDQNGRPTITATYEHYSTPGTVFTKTVNPSQISYNQTTDTYSVTIKKPQATVSRGQAIVDRLGELGYEGMVNNAGSTWTGARIKHAVPGVFRQGQDYFLDNYSNDFAGITLRISPSRNTITTLVQQRMNTGKTTTKTLQYQMD